MPTMQNSLSVAQAAALCGVGRTTVGYWIRSKKLRANRVGRNYSIPVQDLLYFLKSTGQKIPAGLQAENLKGPIFKSFQHCWEYWQGRDPLRDCKACVAFMRRVDVCFTAKNIKDSKCSKECDLCHYYVEIFLPKIHFVNQIDTPAAIIKDLYFWCGNSKWAGLCEVFQKDLIGLGIGPTLVGVLNDVLEPRFGVEAIRYSLLLVIAVNLWAAVHSLLAARTLREDLAHSAAAEDAGQGRVAASPAGASASDPGSR